MIEHIKLYKTGRFLLLTTVADSSTMSIGMTPLYELLTLCYYDPDQSGVVCTFHAFVQLLGKIHWTTVYVHNELKAIKYHVSECRVIFSIALWPVTLENHR